MDEKSYYSRLFVALAMVLLFGIIVLQYVCPTSDCQLLHLASLSSRLGSRAPGNRTGGINGASTGDPYSSEDGAMARFVPRFNFTTKDLNRVVNFNIKGDDVIVFLHIQKTGGTTFGRHLVRNIQLERPCECHAGQKKCTCYRPGKRDTWLFSRFSTGWSCGLHADWTELTNCVPSFMSNRESQERRKTPSRNYYYITILRDPVWRYLSEWRHVQRGATWKASKHMCDGRLPTLNELPSCYTGDDWSGCPLEEFMVFLCARTTTEDCDEKGRRKSRRNEETIQVNNDLHHHKVPHLDGAADLVCVRTSIPAGLCFGTLSSPLTRRVCVCMRLALAWAIFHPDSQSAHFPVPRFQLCMLSISPFNTRTPVD